VTDLELAAPQSASGSRIIEHAKRPVMVARLDQTVAEVLQQPGAEGLRQFPVVASAAGETQVIGMLRRQDIVAAYLKGRTRIASFRRRVSDGASQAIESVEVPVERTAPANGRTLVQVGLPQGVVVVAVHRDDTLLISRGNLRLVTGDRVQLMGASRDLPRALQLLQG
jgi:hypothetical protein